MKPSSRARSTAAARASSSDSLKRSARQESQYANGTSSVRSLRMRSASASGIGVSDRSPVRLHANHEPASATTGARVPLGSRLDRSLLDVLVDDGLLHAHAQRE